MRDNEAPYIPEFCIRQQLFDLKDFWIIYFYGISAKRLASISHFSWNN